MFNLIKMNLYRMINTKSMWVLLLIPCAFCILSLTWLDEEMQDDGPNTFSEAFMEGWNEADEELKLEEEIRAQLGEDATDEEVEALVKQTLAEKAAAELAEKEAAGNGEVEVTIGYHNNHDTVGEGGIIGYVWDDYSSAILTLFTTIAAVIFINAENSTGFVKNLASQNISKRSILLSKLIALYVYCFVMMLMWFVITTVGLLIVYHGDVSFGMDILPEAICGIGAIYLLTIAFTTGVALLTTITKSTALSMSVSIIINTGFFAFLYAIIESKFNFAIAKYVTMPVINEIVPFADNDVILRGFLVGIAYTLVYNVIGAVWVTKRDVA